MEMEMQIELEKVRQQMNEQLEKLDLQQYKLSLIGDR